MSDRSYTVQELINSLNRVDPELLIAVEQGLGATPLTGWRTEYNLIDRATDKRVDLLVLEVA